MMVVMSGATASRLGFVEDPDSVMVQFGRRVAALRLEAGLTHPLAVVTQPERQTPADTRKGLRAGAEVPSDSYSAAFAPSQMVASHAACSCGRHLICSLIPHSCVLREPPKHMHEARGERGSSAPMQSNFSRGASLGAYSENGRDLRRFNCTGERSPGDGVNLWSDHWGVGAAE